ncbi:hypothetical protein D3C87_1836630 [compost metagenome]
MRLLAIAATVPATWVPWPWSSVASLSLFTMSRPVSTWPARSGWVALTPVSITATLMPAPEAVGHTWGALTSATPHESANWGSLGAWKVVV